MLGDQTQMDAMTKHIIELLLYKVFNKSNIFYEEPYADTKQTFL